TPRTTTVTTTGGSTRRHATGGGWVISARVSGAAQHLGDEERQLQGLDAVQPRVAHRLVAGGQVELGDLLAPADTLGHVVAGELDVDAARPRAERAVYVEEALHLADDVLEAARLVTGRGLERVAVHR